MNNLIRKVPTIKKIILFGSYSRDKPHFGSDVDLLIIVEKRTTNDFEKIYEALYDFSLEFEWSPLIVSEKRFMELKNEYLSIFREILKNGNLIWSKE